MVTHGIDGFFSVLRLLLWTPPPPTPSPGRALAPSSSARAASSALPWSSSALRVISGRRAYQFLTTSCHKNQSKNTVQRGPSSGCSCGLLRLVYRYDASTSISTSASISHVWTGTTQAQAQEKETRACAFACVVPWIMLVLMLASYV